MQRSEITELLNQVKSLLNSEEGFNSLTELLLNDTEALAVLNQVLNPGQVTEQLETVVEEANSESEQSEEQSEEQQEVPPVTQEQELPPVTQEEESPVTQEQELPPVTQEQELPPVTQEQELPPVTQEQEESPVIQEQEESPVTKEQEEPEETVLYSVKTVEGEEQTSSRKRRIGEVVGETENQDDAISENLEVEQVQASAADDTVVEQPPVASDVEQTQEVVEEEKSASEQTLVLTPDQTPAENQEVFVIGEKQGEEGSEEDDTDEEEQTEGLDGSIVQELPKAPSPIITSFDVSTAKTLEDLLPPLETANEEAPTSSKPEFNMQG